MEDLMRAKDIIDEIKKHKEAVAGNEEGLFAEGYRMAHDHIAEVVQVCVPTVDAVEVVRCKDCKSCGSGIDEDGKPFLKCLVWMYGGKRPNDFCSYAERKDNGNV